MNNESAPRFFSGESSRERINPWRMFTGAMVPNWLLSRRELSQGAKLCYARLCQHAGEKGYCWPGQHTLARELGVGERQVRSYLHELEEFKLIVVEQRGLKKSNLYYFLNHAWIYEGQSKTPSAAGLDRKNSSFQERQNDADKKIQKESNHVKRKNIGGCDAGSGAIGQKPIAPSEPDEPKTSTTTQEIPCSEFKHGDLQARLEAATALLKAHSLYPRWMDESPGSPAQHAAFEKWRKLFWQSSKKERVELLKLREAAISLTASCPAE